MPLGSWHFYKMKINCGIMKYINSLWHLTVCLYVYLTKFKKDFYVKVTEIDFISCSCCTDNLLQLFSFCFLTRMHCVWLDYCIHPEVKQPISSGFFPLWAVSWALFLCQRIKANLSRNALIRFGLLNLSVTCDAYSKKKKIIIMLNKMGVNSKTFAE